MLFLDLRRMHHWNYQLIVRCYIYLILLVNCAFFIFFSEQPLSRQESIKKSYGIESLYTKEVEWEEQNIQDIQDLPFSYLMNEPELCDRSVTIINVIPIKARLQERREVIREQWASSKYLSVTGMRTVFIIGYEPIGYFQHLINDESKKYRDIIQINVTEKYTNLNLKTLAMMHWTQRFCPLAKWIVKCDDDVMLNPFGVSNYLRGKSDLDFVCRMAEKATVCRQRGPCPRKWVISYDQYLEKYYPTYCQGPAYIMSSAMVRKIYRVSNMTHPFPLEDVYFTGILAEDFHPAYDGLDRTSYLNRPENTSMIHLDRTLFIIELDFFMAGNQNKTWRSFMKHYNIS